MAITMKMVLLLRILSVLNLTFGTFQYSVISLSNENSSFFSNLSALDIVEFVGTMFSIVTGIFGLWTSFTPTKCL